MTELWLSSYDKQHKNRRKNEAVYRRFAEQAGFRKQKISVPTGIYPDRSGSAGRSFPGYYRIISVQSV